MQALQARLDGILQATVDGVVVSDSHGIIEAFNPAAECMFEYSADEVVGRNVAMLMPGHHAGRHDSYMQHYLETGERHIIGIGRELTGRRSNGSEFPIHLSLGTVTIANDRLFIATIRDISEQKAVEESLQMQRDNLAHAGRISTLGEMASGIAHEINQPLTAIATYAQVAQRMLKAENIDVAKQKRLLETIAEQAVRASDVIKRLRSFSRRQASEMRPFDVNEAIRRTVRLASIDASTLAPRFETPGAEEGLYVIGDQIQIEQVLLNLVRNAMEALMENPLDNRVVRLTTQLNDDGYVTIGVADNGPGIPSRVIDNIFEPFFSTKDDGTGLGLPISASIIEAHRGRLIAANTGRGTEFCFRLPVAD